MYKKILAGFLAFIIVFSDGTCNVLAKGNGEYIAQNDLKKHIYTAWEQDELEAEVQLFENSEDIMGEDATESDTVQDELSDPNDTISDEKEATEAESDEKEATEAESDEKEATEAESDEKEATEIESNEKEATEVESDDKEAVETEDDNCETINIEDNEIEDQEKTSDDIEICATAVSDFNYTILNGSYIKLTGYTGADREVTVPFTIDGYIVQSMENVFKNNETVEVVTLPDSLETLGDSNFYKCTKLKSVIFNSNITCIGNSCFYGCTGLEGTLTIPSPITSIGSSAYYNCSGIDDIAFPSGLQSIESNAFYGCTGLTKIEIPDSVKSIGYSVFENCSSLTTINYPVSWSTANSYGHIFNGTKVEEIEIPEGVTKLPAYAFKGCPLMKRVALPSTLTEISESAFFDCTGLTGVGIPEKVTSIGASAFYGCTNITGFDLPGELKSIGSKAFYGCTGLTAIELPDSVGSMGYSVFENCSSLTTVNYPVSWGTVDSYGHIFNGTKVEEIEIPEGVTKLPAYAFRGCPSIKRVVLPSTLTEISGSAFSGCTGLADIAVPEGVIVINSSAFYGCTGMREISLPEGLGSIGSKAFYGCSGLTEIKLPDSVGSMENSIFENCSNLVTINYPVSWNAADSYGHIFNGTKVRTITVPEGVTVIPQYAFKGCSNLVTVNLPSGLTTISANAFENCTSLERIPVPDTVTNIGNSAFLGCQSLKEIVLKDCVSIGNSAFSGCSRLERIWINPGVTSIGRDAFGGCSILVIHGEAGSYAESYASANNIEFSTDTFELEAVADIRGRVCDKRTGSGIKDVTINVFDTVTGKDVGTYTSDENGEYYFKAVVGHKIKVIYCHMRYKFDSPFVIYTVKADSNELDDNRAGETVTGYSDESDFTISAIDSLNVRITGYTGNDAVVVIPKTIKGSTVQSIAENCFKGNKSITKVVFAAGITSVESGAFYGCTGLTEVSMPYGLRTINSKAFYGCTGLTEVELPDSVSSMGYSVFENCSSLTTVNYPVSWSTADSYGHIFNGTKVEEIEIPEGVTKLPAYAFKGCPLMKRVALPSTLTEISESAFFDCTGLTGVGIPEKVTSVGASAFYGCINITGFDLPGGLKSIGSKAFYGCTGLTAIELPDSVGSMGYSVFENCSSLTTVNYPVSWGTVDSYGHIFNGTKVEEIEIPEGVTKLPAYAFRGCPSIKRVVLPSTLTEISGSAFSGCTGLADIAVPEGVTVINSSAFYGCTGMREISLPEGLGNIGSKAFYGCSGLTEIKLPDSVSSMENSVFENCSNLVTINYPVSWNAADSYGHIFNGTKIRTITIPEGVTVIPQYAFKGCSNLVTVNLPSGLTTISANAFENCTGMIHFIFSDKVREVGDYAFAGCKNLKSVSMTESVSYISSSAFSNCVKLTIYCPMYSYAAVYAMDNRIPTNFTQDFPYDLAATGLDFDHSSYYLDMLKLSASGTIDFTLDYNIKDEWYSDLSDMMITVHIPDNAELVNRSLRKDGVPITDFTNSDNTLRFSITDQSGKVHFSLKPDDQIHVKSYASISYVMNGEVHQDIIGIIDTKLPVLTLDMNKTTNSGNIQITGIAPSQAEVNIYVGDDQVSSVHASRAGKYSATITIPTDKMYAIYTITVRCIDNKAGVLSASADVTYGSNYPEINKFVMQYNGKEYDLLDINNKNPIITFVPSKPMTFELEFDNADSVEDVYVVSDRNNVKKYLKAEYDEKTNSFITNGRFDPQNNNYVPGTITVEYSRKKKQIPISSDYDFVNEIINPTLGDKVIGSTSSTTTEDNVTTTTVKFGGDVGDLISEEIKLVITTMDSEYGADLSGIMKGYDGFYSYFFDVDGKKYVLNLDYTDPKTYVTIVHDISGNKMIQYAVSAWETPSNSVQISEILGKLSTAKYVTGSILDMLEINEDDEELRDKIEASSLSWEEKQEALKKADELNRDRQMFLTLSTLISVSVMGFTGPSAVVFGLIFGAITTSSSFFWDARMAGILEGGSGVSASWRWKVDPSGTVYEAVPTNPLPGVTVTAYYKDADTGEKILWDADEWDQTNPLLTDEVGFYAWDVPEGLWQVSFEKDGYESKVSEWIEVAPPQTDVNASLVSRVSPVIESYAIGDSFAEVTFSKYMQPDTVSTLVLKDGNGKIIPYILEYDTGETSDSGKILARTYHLVYEDYVALRDSEYTITTNESILSYSGAKTVSNVYRQEAKPWNVIIVGNEHNEIIDNETIRLTAKYRDTGEELKNCIWSIRESDQAYAFISEDGIVTASPITDGKPHDIIVSVKTSADSEVESMYKLTIVPSEILTVGSVTANIASGKEVEKGTKIILTCETPDSKIYYTVDGTNPSVESILYTDAIVIEEDIIIKAFAVKNGYQDSSVETFIYAVLKNGSGDNSSDVLPEDIPAGGIPTGIWIPDIKNVTYNGEAIKPAIRVYDKNTLLKEKTDYTVSYKNNKNVGKATVIVTSKGNYSGKETITFMILPKEISEVSEDISAMDLTVKENGKIQKPVPVVQWGTRKLKNKTDFTVEYPDTLEGAYRKAGSYEILIKGKGNYTGERTVTLMITPNSLLSKATVSKIANQTYTGSGIEPVLTVKYGKTVLKEGTDYTVTYENNIEIGTATAVLTGIGNYSGEKRVTFKITGGSISKAKVSGVTASLEYSGKEILQNCVLTVTVNKEMNTLQENKDYTVSYQKNVNAGTATIIFTGINGYSGTLKKTFKITAYDLAKDNADLLSVEENLQAAYAKGGSKPKPLVTFDGKVLQEGTNYTLAYKNNTAIGNGNARKQPTVTIIGKGNFKGTVNRTFTITQQDIGVLTLTAPDKVYQNKKNVWKSNVTITDLDGKKLAAGKDYSKTLKYTYAEAVMLADGREKNPGDVIDASDILPQGTVVEVTAAGVGNYSGMVSGTYRIVKSDIGKATVKVQAQTYTGQEIRPGKDQVTVKVGKVELEDADYEIVSYSNNVKKGTATAVLRGVGDYGGTKTVKFTIKSKGFLWWWRNLLNK